jgi:hypothetical protein
VRLLSPSIKLNVSFDFTETSSPQRLHGERSPSQRRALVIKTPSLRQLVESEGAVQSIHRCDAENPLNRSYIPSVFLWIIIFMKVVMMNDFYVLCIDLLVRGENFC